MAFSKGKDKLDQAVHNPTFSDPLEFESLFHQQWPRICEVLFGISGDWSEAEDLAVEVFWKLYSRPPRSRDNLAGWLYRTATHLGLNALRARKRRLYYEEKAGFQALDEDPPWDPASRVEQAQERARVRAVLAQIKPRDAQILILRYSGLSYVEVAAALDVAPGSVGTLLARAERAFEQQYRMSSDLRSRK